MAYAGSERVGKSEATGDRLEEAKHINKSLSALGDIPTIFIHCMYGAFCEQRTACGHCSLFQQSNKIIVQSGWFMVGASVSQIIHSPSLKISRKLAPVMGLLQCPCRC